MQFATQGITWPEWLDDNPDADDATKLAALREYIADTARLYVGREKGLTAAWMNKKLLGLGITDLIENEHTYVMQTTLTGTVDFKVYARNRAEAMQKAADRLPGLTANVVVNEVHTTTDPTLIDGPEDPTGVADDDAPQTVDATLAEFREVIMLGHISGPKYCEQGANRILADYGLAPIPAMQEFTITRPIEGVLRTTVRAYDQSSAARVAGWRWENDRQGYEIAEAEATDAPSVSQPVA